MEKQRQRDFLELEDTIKSRISFMQGLNFSEDEIKIRKEELEIILKKISKVKYYRAKPLDSVSTVHGIKFSIGDKFIIPGNLETKYKIVLFPDAVTIRGECDNPNIGEPYTCESYIETIRKVKETKPKRIKKENKPKKIKLEVGDYFALISNNTIYKVVDKSKKKVSGENKLKTNNTISFNPKKTEFVLKTRKDYKKQFKAEKDYKK